MQDLVRCQGDQPPRRARLPGRAHAYRVPVRVLSLPWLVGALGARLLSEPDRIRLRFRAGRHAKPSSAAARIDRAVALDDLEVAEELLTLVPSGDPQYSSLSAAVLLLGGHITAAEAQASAARDGRARAQRVLRRARELREESASPVPLPGSPSPRRAPSPPGSSRRVLHVVKNSLPQTQAGYTLRTQAVLRAQSAAGLDVRAVTRLGFPVAQGHLADRVDVVDGIAYHRLLAMRGTDVAEYGRRLTSFARSQRIDVIHAATDHVNGHAAMAACSSLGLPFVYEVRGFLEDSWACRHGGDSRASATDRYRWARARETEAMLAADAIVTLSRSMAADIAERGVPADRIWLVPNGVDDAYLAAPRDQSSARSLLGLPDDRMWVGAVTTIHEYEGLGTLLEAVAIARRAGADVGAVIVGDGPALRRLKASAPDDGTVRWVGRVPGRSSIDWYDALDAVVVPRQDHRVTRLVTPLKPVEALARARLVIASDLPALREATGEYARFVPPGDASALAEELALVDHHRDLGTAGREWVQAERRWSQVCSAYDDAYAAASDR